MDPHVAAYSRPQCAAGPSGPCPAAPSLSSQHAVWQLGAPTVSLMAGLRLVSAILLSRLILGTSAVQTGVQVGWAGLHLNGGMVRRDSAVGAQQMRSMLSLLAPAPAQVVSIPALLPACPPAFAAVCWHSGDHRLRDRIHVVELPAGAATAGKRRRRSNFCSGQGAQ